jgi:hypothetical protein
VVRGIFEQLEEDAMESLTRRDPTTEPVSPIRDAVRDRYGLAARRVAEGTAAGETLAARP